MRSSFFVVGLLLAGASLARGAESIDYHSPELFESQGRAHEFLPYAKKFLADNATVGVASRVAMDILMVAATEKKADEVKQAKLLLLLDYPHSLQTAYLTSTLSASDVKELLKDRFDLLSAPLDRRALARFSSAVQRLSATYGDAFGSDELWAQATFAARDRASAEKFRAKIKKPGTKSAKMADLALELQDSPKELFIALQKERAQKTARAYQQFLYREELTDDDRETVEVMTVVAANYLYDCDYDEALPVIEKLCAKASEPRFEFWRAWALAANDRVPEAVEILAKFEVDASPWSKTAEELHGVLKDLELAITESNDAIDKAYIHLLTSTPHLIEGTLEIRSEGLPSLDVYLGVDLPRDAVEVAVVSQKEVQIAYRTMPDCQVFVHGSPTIQKYVGQGMSLVFDAGIKPHEDGRQNWYFNWKAVGQGQGGLVKSLTSILAQESFREKKQRHALLQQLVAGGTFPRRVRHIGENLQLEWVTPVVEEPELNSMKVTLNAKHQISEVRIDEYAIKNIRYGKRDEMKLDPPSWPQLPVETLAEFGARDFMRLLSVVMELAEKHAREAGLTEEIERR
jgi:hypothetical protein